MKDALFEHLRQYGRNSHLIVLVSLFIPIASFFGLVAGFAVVLGLLSIYLAGFCLATYRQQDRFEPLGRQLLASPDLRMARNRLANSKTQRLVAEQSRRLKAQRLNPNRPRATPLRLRHP